MEDYSTEEPGQWAIQVDGPDVLIDLDGHSLTGAGGASTASGISGTNSPGLLIRNGTIGGFLFGIRVENAQGSVQVENVYVTGSARGALLRSEEIYVRDSTFADLGGFAGWPAAHTIALEIFASECQIIGNSFSEIYPISSTEGIAISLSSPPDECVIQDNTIVNASQPRVGRGIALWLGGRPLPRSRLEISRNTVSGFAYAYMASPLFHAAIVGNEFEIDCMPDRVRTYGSGAETNSFTPTDVGCRDTIPYLRELAASGDPEWQVRLAAALLEEQSTLRPPEERCVQLSEARQILLPLKDTMIQASEQMVRVEAGLQSCR